MYTDHGLRVTKITKIYVPLVFLGLILLQPHGVPGWSPAMQAGETEEEGGELGCILSDREQSRDLRSCHIPEFY